MKHKTLIDRLVTFGLALFLVVAITVAYQMGVQSDASSASEALAAGAAAQAGTGYISVPAAAFVPEHYLVDYQQAGRNLSLNNTGGIDLFFAPLHLPHGATVTKMTLHFFDNDSAGLVILHMFAGADFMAQINSTDVGYSSLSTTSFSNAVVDNSQYAYYLELHMTSTSVDLREVFIEFTYPTYLPSIQRNS